MSQEPRPLYEFGDLPVEPIRPGTSLLVAGPALAGTRDLTLRLLAAGEQGEEGLLVLAIDDSASDLVTDYQRVGGTFDRRRMAAVECGGPDAPDDENVRCVRSPGDLTGIGIEYSSLYEGLYGEGVERVRTGLFSVSTLLMYAEEIQPVYRFLHTLTARVRSADGLAMCVLDPSSHDRRTTSSLAQTFDGRIDLREADGEKQVRIRGLPDQPDGWQSL